MFTQQRVSCPYPQPAESTPRSPNLFLVRFILIIFYHLRLVLPNGQCHILNVCLYHFNPLTPNDHYSGRTAPLTSKRCILYIYSTNIGTEYFKHCIYSPFFFFPLQNPVCFIILFVSCSIHILYAGCAKIKKNNSGAKRLIINQQMHLYNFT